MILRLTDQRISYGQSCKLVYQLIGAQLLNPINTRCVLVASKTKPIQYALETAEVTSLNYFEIEVILKIEWKNIP